MKLMLTSFGIVNDTVSPSEDESIFFRMPPVSMEAIRNTFIPDYEALLICERVIFDESSFERLKGKPHRSYRLVSETIKALHAEGFVELADFKQILNQNKKLLEKMLEHDLKLLDQWIEPLKSSLDIWNHFSRLSWGLSVGGHLPIPMDHLQRGFLMTHEVAHMLRAASSDAYNMSWMLEEALGSSRKRRKREYRNVLRQVLESYLSYVNANIVLSNELGVGFHDWNDFLPFYRHKFLTVGSDEIETEHHISESHKLFEITFPEFAISDTSSLIRALQDKRINSLRELVQEAVEGKVTFDEDFAKRILKEVLGVERRARRYRNITSYLTMPIGFIPWVGTPAQKLVEEVIGTPLENKLKGKYQWFYLMSDLSEKAKRQKDMSDQNK